MDLSEFETHVCLVSHEAAANFLPAVSEEVKPKNIVLIETKEMLEQADYLKKAFKRAIPGVKVFDLKLEDSWDIEKTTKQIYEYFSQNSFATPILNATGGHKLMMLGAYQAFYVLNYPVFYFRIDQGDIQLITLDEQQVKINTIKCEPNLEHYLLAYGYRIDISNKKEELNFDYSRKELCETLIKNYSVYSNGIRAINYMAMTTKNKQSLTYLLDRSTDKYPALIALLEEFEKYKTLKLSADKVEFSSEANRQFVNGGWLESYVYDAICKIVQGKKIAKNISIVTDSRVNNEIDVAFVYDNRLYLVECKTSSDQEKFKDHLYKIDSLAKIGGTHVKKILISYHKINDETTRERAKVNHIDIIDGENLSRLTEDLKKCLKKSI